MRRVFGVHVPLPDFNLCDIYLIFLSIRFIVHLLRCIVHF